MKILFIVLCIISLFVTSIYADDKGIFASYQAGVTMPEDDNFGVDKGFFAQGMEAGYSWKYVEIGCEWYIVDFKTLLDSTFTDHSIIGTVKIKLPLERVKYLERVTPYGVFGTGVHLFTDRDMKRHPDQINNLANGPRKHRG